MSKRPWMKFYPADWRADPAVRSCSLAARGLWIEMLCIMDQATPRGRLLVGNSSPTLRQLASICGCSLKEINLYLAELEAAQVFSRDGEIIFSRRMLRDEEKAERDKANGALGGNPTLNGGVNPQDKAHMLEARSQIPEKKEKKDTCAVAKATRTPVDEFFEIFWKVYPKRLGANPRKTAFDKFERAVKSGVDADLIISAVRVYAAECNQLKLTNTEKVAMASTWLNQQRWGDYQSTAPPEDQAEREQFMADRGYYWDGQKWATRAAERERETVG